MQSRSRFMLALAVSLACAAPTFAADSKAQQAEKSKSEKSDKSDKSAKKSDKSEGIETAHKYPVPAGLRGFDGTLSGTVVSVQDHMRGFVMKVDKVLHTNTRSTAKNPESAVGQEIQISPTTTKDKDGKWVVDDRELRYIQSLTKGQDIQLDVINNEAYNFRIADLTAAEKAQADHEKKPAKKK